MGWILRMKQAWTRRREEKLALGLALGSGGAKGMAHLGILKAFEEEEIKFNYVSGTSIGSVVGALYAKGCTSSDMVQIVEGVSRKEFSKGLNPFSDANFAEEFFGRYLEGDFSALRLPFAAWATDAETNEGVLLKSGNLPRALAASSAMPPYFRAVEIDGRKLFDGAFTNAVPSDACRGLGAKFVVGVDLFAHQKQEEEKGKISRIFDTAISMMTPLRYTEDCRERGRLNADFMLQPDLSEFRATDISRAAMNRMLEIGYEEAKAHMKELKAAIQSRK